MIIIRAFMGRSLSTSIVFCCKHSLDRTVDFLVSFEAGRVSARYPAPFETYLQLQAEQAVSASSHPERPIERKVESKVRPRKLSWKEQQELDSLEPRLKQLAALQAEINASGSDYVRLQSLADQLHALEAELSAAEERWLELSETAD